MSVLAVGFKYCYKSMVCTYLRLLVFDRSAKVQFDEVSWRNRVVFLNLMMPGLIPRCALLKVSSKVKKYRFDMDCGSNRLQIDMIESRHMSQKLPNST